MEKVSVSMESENLSLQYTPADGPKGLEKVLADLLEKTQKHQALAATEHYILYQLGNQKSLIKVDMSQPPFKFWYYDLLGRPATRIVKETIAQFLWEKGGDRERFYKEFQGE
jgi:hypothetical protein